MIPQGGADAAERALAALEPYAAEERLRAAELRLAGHARGPLARFGVGSELAPAAELLDGRLLEELARRALEGARGAVFTGAAEARLLAAMGLARAAARRGADEVVALAALLGAAEPPADLRAALSGLRVLDPSCGGGALLAAAVALARGCAAEVRALGLEVAPLAARAAAARLRLLRADAEVRCADALAVDWPAAELVLANPPFLRHEALAPADKARAAGRSGLSRQADLSAHLAQLALRHADDVGLVWPRALDTSRAAAPLAADARARGGWAFRLRSRVAGSFAASVDTALAVWSRGLADRPAAEAAVALARLEPADLAGLARGRSSPRVRLARGARADAGGAAGLRRVEDACAVRFGLKSGCNAFFHLLPLGGGRFASALAGEVELGPGDAAPILASLREASAPARAAPSRVLFRPAGPGGAPASPASLGAAARAYLALGERLGVAARATCAARRPWWLAAPGRSPAPVLYPAKIGARAFAFVNEAGLWEDKKWHALLPAPGVEPWLLAAVLSSTPVRLAIDLAARQLTGLQAIADVDCRVLAAAPFPSAARLARARHALAAAWAELAGAAVTTDLARALARPAQRELDLAVGAALGRSAAAVERDRAALRARVADRLAKAAHVRRLLEGGPESARRPSRSSTAAPRAPRPDAPR